MKSVFEKNRISAIALLSVALLVVVGCASEESGSTSTADNSVEVTEPKGSTDAQTSDTESPQSTTNLNIAGGNDPEDRLMPDVLCMNLQEAQDEIQDHGVFFSRSVDATGEDRMQLIDSNWIVVGQTPEPGVSIGEGDAVLSVVKIGEPTGGVC